MSKSARKRSAAQYAADGPARAPQQDTVDPRDKKAEPGSKQSRVIAMLQSPAGATIAAMMQATDHRGCLRGTLLFSQRVRDYTSGPTARVNLMKTHRIVALAALAGVGIGGLAAQGIHAQAKLPAYYIAELDVTNEDVYNKQWIPKVDETIKAAGGVLLVRGTNIERIEGPAPKRLFITKWGDIDKLTAWRVSEAYMKMLPILDKATKSVRSYAVEGVN